MRTTRIQNCDPQILLRDTTHEMDKELITSLVTKERMGERDKRNYSKIRNIICIRKGMEVGKSKY